MSDNLVLLSNIIIRHSDLHSFQGLLGAILPLDKFPGLCNKQAELFEVVMEDGVLLMRLRIREGSRFTIMDLDPVTAERWGAHMTNRASAQDDR